MAAYQFTQLFTYSTHLLTYSTVMGRHRMLQIVWPSLSFHSCQSNLMFHRMGVWEGSLLDISELLKFRKRNYNFVSITKDYWIKLKPFWCSKLRRQNLNHRSYEILDTFCPRERNLTRHHLDAFEPH